MPNISASQPFKVILPLSPPIHLFDTPSSATPSYRNWTYRHDGVPSSSTSFEMTKGAEHLEYLRGTRDCDLPFGKGLRKNIGMFCCLRDAWTAPCNGRWGSSLARWSPILWKVPDRIVRDSEDWWAHPWQNKYWSCC